MYRGLLVLLALAFSTLAVAQDAMPAKPPGVVRIGIVQPRVQMAGADATKTADTVRKVLAEYLQGPTIEVALLGPEPTE